MYSHVRAFRLALAGGVDGLLACLAGLPFLPHTSIPDKHLESQFTLGTFYGWFSHLLLGAAIVGTLATAYSIERMDWGPALLHGLVGAVLGGALGCGGDAFSDWLMICMNRSLGS